MKINHIKTIHKKIIFLFSVTVLALILLYLSEIRKKNQPSITISKKQLVMVPGPDVSLNYPNKFLPIQYLKYTKSGLHLNGDLPPKAFPSPYNVKATYKTGESELIVTAVGDIMSNADVQLTAYLHRNEKDESAGGYDWILQPIKEYLTSSDITIGNLETPVAPMFPYTGSNKEFNASPLLLKGLKNAGFNILGVANNHAMDKGEEGLLATLEEIEKEGLSYVGAYKNINKNDFIKFIDCKGFKIAILNLTFKLNHKNLIPNHLCYILPTEDAESVISEYIAKAKKNGAEFIILFLHWGKEYHSMPTEENRNLALKLCINGADMIIGSHPHVIQPMELVYTKRNSIIPSFEQGCKEHLIAYSLGNFISHQRGMAKFGMILKFKLIKDNNQVLMTEVNPLIIENKIINDENIYLDEVYSFDTFRPYLTTLETFKEYITQK